MLHPESHSCRILDKYTLDTKVYWIVHYDPNRTDNERWESVTLKEFEAHKEQEYHDIHNR